MAPEKGYEMEPGGEFAVQSATRRLTEQQRIKQIAAEALEMVTAGVETSTDYLTGRGMVGVVKDMGALIRRYPFQTLLLGFALGYALSRPKQR